MSGDTLFERLNYEVQVTWKHVCMIGGGIVVLLLGVAGQAAVLAARADRMQVEIDSRRGVTAELVRVSTDLNNQVRSAAEFRQEVRGDIDEIKRAQHDIEEKLDRLIQLQLQGRRNDYAPQPR